MSDPSIAVFFPEAMHRPQPPSTWPWRTTLVAGLAGLSSLLFHLDTAISTDTPTLGTFFGWFLVLVVQVGVLLVNLIRMAYAWGAHRRRPSRRALWSLAIPLGIGLLCLIPLSQGAYIP